ncbi:MAG: ABC transporter permease, partial [Acidimicrobiia bacterium]
MSRRLIVEPRGLAPWWLKLLIPIGSVFAALIVGALFLNLTGNDWLEVYGKMLDTAFGSGRGFAETLVSATPLILTGVAAAIAFKMLVWNIGGEGQLIFGAIAAAGVGIWLSGSTPPLIAITAVVLAGAVGGAFWASLSAVPKVYLGTNEIITTLMLNFIALNLMNYLVLGSFSPWRDPESSQFPQGRPIIESGRIP